MEFYHYAVMMIGSSVALLVLEICVFVLLPNRLLAEMIEKIFEIIRIDQHILKMNFFGIQIDFVSSRRFRLSLIIQLSFTASTILLLLLDGCIMQVNYFSKEDSCPSQLSDCFTMETLSGHERIVCPPGEILSNLTSSNTVCFTWIYAEQDTLSVLNQIGICSSVFALLCHTFKYFCRMSRKWWGLILLILLVLLLITLLIISFIIEIPISVITALLLFGLSCLLINVIQLLQFTHSCKCHPFILSTK